LLELQVDDEVAAAPCDASQSSAESDDIILATRFPWFTSAIFSHLYHFLAPYQEVASHNMDNRFRERQNIQG
jgi:hypothetical protein